MTLTEQLVAGPEPTASVRERILAAAARQYYTDGIRAASADKLIAEAGVSKVTFYRHFPGKDELVVAYLAGIAEQERAAVTAHRVAHPDDPAATLRWYADGVGAMACGRGFRGCPFLNATAELADTGHPGRQVVAEHRAWLTGQVAELVVGLGAAPDRAAATARQLMMLRDGAMVAGHADDPAAVADALVAAGRAVLGSALSGPRQRA